MRTSPSIRPIPRSEEGYILLFVIFMLALLTLSLAIAAPKVAREIQRDREVETMHRGKQYIRALKLYYKKFGSYPPNVDALIKPSSADGVHFLRKKYVDPTTGKDEWKPVYFAMNKAPTVLGFFGQPVAGSTISAVLVDCSALPTGGASGGNSPGAGAGSSGSGFSSGGSSSFGSSNTGNGMIPSPCDNTGTPDANGNSNPNDPNAANSGSGSSSATNSNSNSSNSPGQSGQTNGQTFGGKGIIGFSPNSPKASILVYKKKKFYNQWEFVYDPISEQMVALPAGTGIPGGTPTPNGTTSSNSFMQMNPQNGVPPTSTTTP